MLFFALIMASSVARSDEPLKPEDANPQTFALDTFTKEFGVDPVSDQLVRLKFNYRDSDVSDAEEKDTRQGTIQSVDQASHHGGALTVVIPAEGLAWFKRIPTSVDETLNVKTYLVYARVKVDTSGRIFVRLVGTEIKHDDLGGDSIVWQ